MNENKLRFSTCLAQCTFDLHCQMWKVDETVCGINDHTVMFVEVQTNDLSFQIFHHYEMFCKYVISNVKL